MIAARFAVLSLLTLVSAASAEEFQVYGPRAMGMGGAGVAVAEGQVGQYWNPAGLAQPENVSGLQIAAGVHAQFGGSVITGANDVFNVVQACNNANPSVCTSANVTSALSEMNVPGQGALVGVAAGAGIKIGKFTLGLMNETEAGGSPQMDLVNTSTKTSDSTFIGNNTSSLNIEAGAFTAAALSYAHKFFVPGLMVGGTLKATSGTMAYSQFLVAQKQASGTGAFKNLNNTKSTIQPAFDLGLLWDLHQAAPKLPFHPKLGLVGRNLNGPQFDQAPGAIAAGLSSKYTLDPQVRAGLELSPLHWWHLAADMDVSKNTTMVTGLTTQMFSVGTEINVFNRSWINIPVRAGLTKDMNDPNSKLAYTAGLGLNFLHIIVDLGGQISSQTVSTGNGSNVPNFASAAAQIGIMF